MTNTTDTRPKGSSRGFTLIELMIVIGIIGILSVALLPALINAMGAGKQGETSARIELVKTMVESYERKMGDYPPSDGARKGVKFKNDPVNQGIECLLVHLGQKNLGSNLSFDDKRAWLGNTDGDNNQDEIPEMRTNEKFEVLDGWGNPLVYFHNSHYGKPQKVMIPDEEGSAGGQEVTVHAMKDDRGYVNPRKYQLISAGDDMKFGTIDDVCYPALSRTEK